MTKVLFLECRAPQYSSSENNKRENCVFERERERERELRAALAPVISLLCASYPYIYLRRGACQLEHTNGAQKANYYSSRTKVISQQNR
jgi:hypothetical protein